MKPLDILGLTFAMLSVAFCVFGLSRLQSNTEDVLQWLPDQSQARNDYDYFESLFGSDDFLIVTWNECTVDDPRLGKFAQHLRSNDPQDLIQAVVNGAEVTQWLKRDLGFSERSIARRMKGVFFGASRPELTCTTIELTHAGTSDRTAFMKLVFQAIDSVPDLERESVAFGGYPYIGTYIDRQLKNSFRVFLGPSILLATLVALICLRDFSLSCIVFVTAAGAALVSVSLVPAFGMKFGGLMSIIPALVFVLGTSGSIHLVRYSLDVVGDPRKLLAIGWKPCTISAATTSAGMLSLTRSSFPAIRNFGFFCALGVAAALVFQLVLVPWLLHRFGATGLKRLAAREHESRRWLSLVEFLKRQRSMVTAIGLSFMLFSAFGIPRLVAEVEVEKLFRPDSEILHSLAAMEKQLGPMDQTELLVEFQSADAEHFPDRAKLVRRIQSAVARLPDVSVTHSLINFLPTEPRKSNLRGAFNREMYRVALRRERDKFSESNLLNIKDQRETWRISLRFPFTQKKDFDQLAANVLDVSSPLARQFGSDTAGSSTPAPKLIYTGKTHLFNHAQLTLLSDLTRNFILAFIIITPMMILVLRSLPIGILAMLPNLFPILAVFGSCGWLGIPIDLSLAMTASVALGIAVDDTTHFLIRFREFGGSLTKVRQPVELAISQCGPAMLYTTMIGSAGLIVYYFGEMLVIARFSCAITLMLVIALLADVLMLPCLLFVFGRSPGQTAKAADSASVHPIHE